MEFILYILFNTIYLWINICLKMLYVCSYAKLNRLVVLKSDLGH